MKSSWFFVWDAFLWLVTLAFVNSKKNVIVSLFHNQKQHLLVMCLDTLQKHLLKWSIEIHILQKLARNGFLLQPNQRNFSIAGGLVTDSCNVSDNKIILIQTCTELWVQINKERLQLNAHPFKCAYLIIKIMYYF